MLGWAIGFLLAAFVAGLFAFGVLDTRFADIAMDLLWGLVALFGASLLFAVVGGKSAAPFSGSGRGFARLTFVAAVASLGYVWIDRNWSNQRAAVLVDAEQAAKNSDAASRNAFDPAPGEARDDLGADEPEAALDSAAPDEAQTSHE